MTYKIGESIANIQIAASALQKECAVFNADMEQVINLAKSIQLNALTLMSEYEDGNESTDGRADKRPVYGGVVVRSTCRTCRYWNDLEGDGEESFEGECRRRTPELLLDDEHGVARLWPPVDNLDWCGEYEAGNLQ